MFDTRARMTPKGRSICEFAPSHQTIPLHPHPNVTMRAILHPGKARSLLRNSAAGVCATQPPRSSTAARRATRAAGRLSRIAHPPPPPSTCLRRARARKLVQPARPHPLPAPPTAARPGSVQPSPAGIRTAGTHPTPPRPAARSRSCCTSTRAVAPACTACRRAGGRRSR